MVRLGGRNATSVSYSASRVAAGAGRRGSVVVRGQLRMEIRSTWNHHLCRVMPEVATHRSICRGRCRASSVLRDTMLCVFACESRGGVLSSVRDVYLLASALTSEVRAIHQHPRTSARSRACESCGARSTARWLLKSSFLPDTRSSFLFIPVVSHQLLHQPLTSP
jgi:hypothetical protein